MTTTSEFKEQAQQITDPVEALRFLVENETFLGYDSYYADLRDAMLEMAERVVAAQIKKD